MFIAQDAWIWGASSLVFGGEVTDDLFLEFLRLVNQVEWDAEVIAHRAHIIRSFRAAAFEQVFAGRKAILLPQLERDADYVVALFKQYRRRCRGVHPSAHANDDALTLLRIHSGTLYKARAVCKMVCAKHSISWMAVN